MTSGWVFLVTFGSTVGGVLLGTVLRALLPAAYLNTETKEVVRLGVGLLATLAVAISLMIASAKTSTTPRMPLPAILRRRHPDRSVARAIWSGSRRGSQVAIRSPPAPLRHVTASTRSASSRSHHLLASGARRRRLMEPVAGAPRRPRRPHFAKQRVPKRDAVAGGRHRPPTAAPRWPPSSGSSSGRQRSSTASIGRAATAPAISTRRRPPSDSGPRVALTDPRRLGATSWETTPSARAVSTASRKTAAFRALDQLARHRHRSDGPPCARVPPPPPGPSGPELKLARQQVACAKGVLEGRGRHRRSTAARAG